MYNEIKSYSNEHNVLLVAVSKTKPTTAIQSLYDLGQRDFGENKVQEMVEKHKQLPSDIRWHLIGHLQKNKVKHVASFAYMIHAVDSLELLETINNQAAKHGRKIPVLLQFHIASENTKFGFSFDEACDILDYITSHPMQNVLISGVMGMATFTDDQNTIRKEFKLLKIYFDQIKTNYYKSDNNFKHISMGMSGDYLIAIEEGATIVRIGSSIFGSRN